MWNEILTETKTRSTVEDIKREKEDIEHLQSRCRKGHVLHSRPRLRCGNLNKDKYDMNLIEEPMCACSAGAESVRHFCLEGPL